MTIQENISLAPYTTFKLGGSARFFCAVKDLDEARQAVIFAKEKKVPFFVLGGGSNILVADEGFNGLVIKVEIIGRKIQDSGFKIQEKNSDFQTIVSVGAGESWDDFVEYTIANGLNGLENLSAIPGTVGAAPVQNIGAYGAEIRQFISSVHALDTKTMEEVAISARDCHFGYRNSMFKHEKGRYIITSVDFILKRDGNVNIEYKDLKNYFGKIQETKNNNKTNSKSEIANSLKPSPRDVREAVINIRWNKLPDWHEWGTAGSFFKNPVVSKEKFDELKAEYPGLPGFPEATQSGEVGDSDDSGGQIKIPLGWVLDNICKAKGAMSGGVGTYKNQALVIVTKPGATSAEVVAFTRDLMEQVKEKTGIVVEAEVEWVN